MPSAAGRSSVAAGGSSIVSIAGVVRIIGYNGHGECYCFLLWRTIAVSSFLSTCSVDLFCRFGEFLLNNKSLCELNGGESADRKRQTAYDGTVDGRL